MKLLDVLTAFTALSLLLLVGVWLRRRIPLLRRLGLPEALIAGVVGLLVGPFSPLRPFPEAVYRVWSETPGVQITPVFAGLFLGQSLASPADLWRRATGQTAFGMVLSFGQYVVGGAMVLLAAAGLLLLRMADPAGRSGTLESFSFKQLLYEPLLGGGLVTAFAPLAMTAWGVSGWMAVCLAVVLFWLGVSLVLARRR